MSNFEYLQYLIARYISIINLCEMSGIKSKETEWKLESCFYMLGQIARSKK